MELLRNNPWTFYMLIGIVLEMRRLYKDKKIKNYEYVKLSEMIGETPTILLCLILSMFLWLPMLINRLINSTKIIKNGN